MFFCRYFFPIAIFCCYLQGGFRQCRVFGMIHRTQCVYCMCIYSHVSRIFAYSTIVLSLIESIIYFAHKQFNTTQGTSKKGRRRRRKRCRFMFVISTLIHLCVVAQPLPLLLLLLVLLLMLLYTTFFSFCFIFNYFFTSSLCLIFHSSLIFYFVLLSYIFCFFFAFWIQYVLEILLDNLKKDREKLKQKRTIQWKN